MIEISTHSTRHLTSRANNVKIEYASDYRKVILNKTVTIKIKQLL